MKNILLILVITGFSFNPTPDKRDKFIDPTGTYILKGETKRGRIVSHSGEVRIKLLDEHKVGICFFISKGYPGYETGSFVDSLEYDNNRILYKPEGSGCTVAFWVDEMSLSTEQYFTDPRSACGFPAGVMVSASFEKKSADVPVIQDLSARNSH
jgi:hypothetical protein